VINNVVFYQGSSYVSLVNSNLNNIPPATLGSDWAVLAEGAASSYAVYNPLDYGAVGNGTTDDTSAIQACILACITNGGGVVFFQSYTPDVTDGLYLWTANNYVLPTSSIPTAVPYGYTRYQQPGIRFTGDMSNANVLGDTPQTTSPAFGPIILFKDTSQGVWMTGYGSGKVEVDHLTFFDTSTFAVAGGGTRNTFFQFTNPIFDIHHNTFAGTTSLHCVNDILIAGSSGATTPGDGSGAIFQGYGSLYHDNFHINIRHIATLYNAANSIRFRDNEHSNTCGTNLSNDAPYILDGTGGEVQGNSFDGDTIELFSALTPGSPVSTYTYAMKFTNGASNNYVHEDFWDAGSTVTAACYFDATCFGNNIVMGVCQTISGGYLPLRAGPGVGQQTCMDGQMFNGGLYSGANPYVPIGGIILWAGPWANIPYGWFICDGATFSATNYPQLAAALGGTTLPDFTQSFPYGGIPPNNVPTYGGSPFITVSNMPSHNHGPQSPQVDFLGGGSGLPNAEIVTSPSGGYGYTTGTGYTGSGVPYYPPYIGVYFLMRGY
jgi:hypothetical protein